MKCLGYVSGLSLALVLSMGLSGCGGGGSSDNNGGSSTETGTFVDAPVQGLSYSTATQSGITDVNGTYKFKKGETVTFKIGELVLGKALAKPIVTPLTLAGDTNVSNPSQKAVNIARILQSLDDNTSDTSKIVIPVSLKDLNITDVNLTVNNQAALNKILQKAEDKTGKSYTLEAAADAKKAMYSSFNKYIYAGTYSVTATNNASLSNSAADCTAQEKGTVTITPDGNVTGTNLSNTGSVTGNSTVQLNDGSFSGTASDGTIWNVTINTDGVMNGTYNSDNGQCVGTISGAKNTNVSNTSSATPSVSGKTLTVENENGNDDTNATFLPDGNYFEIGTDDGSPHACSGKWISLGDNKIATTCEKNGTTKTPTLSDTVVDFGSANPSIGSKITVYGDDMEGGSEYGDDMEGGSEYGDDMEGGSETVKITAINSYSTPSISGKTLTVDNENGDDDTNTTFSTDGNYSENGTNDDDDDTNATFSTDGNYSENGTNDDGKKYSCSGKWISLSNTQIATTCNSNGTSKIPTSSDFVYDFGTATLSRESNITVYPNGTTNSPETVKITAIN